MAARGRGRGRGATGTGTEQFGFAKNEQLLPILQPLPKYPAIENRAPEFVCSTEMSYLIELKRNIMETMQESPNNVKLKVTERDIERYSDWYKKLTPPEISYDKRFDWRLLPKELKPSAKKRTKPCDKTIVKKQKVIDIDKKLEELEKKETFQENETEEIAKDDEDEEEKEQDDTVEDEEAEADEEMDDGTDYVNNYFDNGEGYDEEDDNLDDGAVY